MYVPNSQKHEQVKREVECQMMDCDDQSVGIDRCETNSLIDEVTSSCRQSSRDDIYEEEDSIDNIKIELLEPITTSAAQTTTMSTLSPKVSREGLRKNKKI